MGILDSKHTVLDVVLTDKGRNLLSKNKLNFKYYAFSDEHIDYSGSVNLHSASFSGNYANLDDFIYRNFTFEADQRAFFNGNQDLKSHLYTVPLKSKTIPEFYSSVNSGSEISLERKYYIQEITDAPLPKPIEKPIDVIVRVEAPKQTTTMRTQGYVDLQKITNISRSISSGKVAGNNIVGTKIGNTSFMISNKLAFDIKSGAVFGYDINNHFLGNSLDNFISPFFKKKKDNQQKPKEVPQIQQSLAAIKKIEKVIGIDEKTIDFSLKLSSGIFSGSGFVIEVYESGSDGKLIKMSPETVSDPITDEETEIGFSDFFIMKVE